MTEYLPSSSGQHSFCKPHAKLNPLIKQSFSYRMHSIMHSIFHISQSGAQNPDNILPALPAKCHTLDPVNIQSLGSFTAITDLIVAFWAECDASHGSHSRCRTCGNLRAPSSHETEVTGIECMNIQSFSELKGSP
ncbi:hypothetical protein [Pannonibacter phragmitetus]|uniref:hypothetical protein n=1 Tax=Pannonibacter phragmitetus TaxID=121719 RepID=UPI0012FD216F|nr:hypothetical protein [Pannonibacter phragmitetus]